MLGWHVSVYRQNPPECEPAKPDSAQGERLAVWQTGAYGIDWLDTLVKDGKAVLLMAGGYPRMYTAAASLLLPRVLSGPPGERAHWAMGPNDVVTERWEGRTNIDSQSAAACSPSEWLIVEAWDES